MKYYSRYIDNQIKKLLRTSGAILLKGPKFCGKTTTALNYAKSNIRLNVKNTIEMVKANPSIALKGEKPHLIDEWQTVKDIFNQVKADLDLNYEFGKYILTGSATPTDTKDIFHTGAGRITSLEMRPMSLFESLDSKGLISLNDLFLNKPIDFYEPNNDFTLFDLAYLTVRGGWPLTLKATNKEDAIQITRNYYKEIFNLTSLENEEYNRKNPDILRSIVKSYARNISTQVNKQTILDDLTKSGEINISRITFDEYLNVLKNLFIIKDIESWNPTIRSKTSIRSTPTRHFNDVSIACAALNLSPFDLINDLNTFGYFFKDLAIRDLSIYMNELNGEVKHYRDNAGLECDAILKLNDGRYGLCEIKIGGENGIKQAKKTLLLLKNKLIEKSEEKAPSFLMILVGSGSPYYINKEGIYVIPINLLKA